MLSSQYTGGPNAGGKGTGTNNSGTLSGSDLWLLYGARLGAATSSSGTIGSSSSNFSALLSLYKDGASAGGQGDEAGGALSNADLWIFYGSGAGAGSSSGSTNGSLANDPALSAQYTDGSGIGPNTPLVYNPQSDGPPVFVTGVLTGNGGNVQFVPVADSTGGQDGGDPPAGRPTWNDAEPYYDGGPRWVFEFEAGVGRYDPRKTGPKPADSDTTADAPRDQSAGATPNADGITRTEERPVAIAETKQFLINTTIDLALALAFSKFFNTGKGGADKNNPLVDANFAQKTYRETFSDTAKFGGKSFAGKNIDDLVKLLRKGELTPADVPLEYLTTNGQTVILNTRSAEALRRAGIPRELWRGIDIADDAAALERLAEQLRKAKLGPEGIPTVRPSQGAPK